ncbi:MAG TPA: hypothetical protein VGT98_14395, partial [Candidatus Elarobacter sp.]|nr:hypothetical protein [Candidatus Elarobacter sp.]
VARRLAFPAVATVALAHEIFASSNLPIATALRIAAELLASPAGAGRLSPSVGVTLDASAFQAGLLDRLAQAVEDAPRPVRGRPRKPPTRHPTNPQQR